jgi:hypothetical protein
MKRLFTIATVALLSLAGGVQAQSRYTPGSAAQIIDTWYRHYLGRAADPQGLEYWVPRLASQDPQQTLGQILASDEYYNRNGGTPEGLVFGLYRDVLARSPAQLDPRAVDYWVNHISLNGSREGMIDEFLHDANTDIFNPPSAPAPAYSAPPPPAPRYTPPAYQPPQYLPPYPPSSRYAPSAPVERPWRHADRHELRYPS